VAYSGHATPTRDTDPGNTEAERFNNAVRKTFTLSKEETQRREAEWQKTQGTLRPVKK
jgi:hypothetical protein